MNTVTVRFDVPREVAMYRLQQMGFHVVDIPTHAPFSAPVVATMPKRTRAKSLKAEREFQRPLIVKKSTVVDGVENVTEREIDGVTVEKEMARVLRKFCANLSTSSAGADRHYPDYRPYSGASGGEYPTTAAYVRSFDSLNNLKNCEYQQLVSFDDGLILGVETDD